MFSSKCLKNTLIMEKNCPEKFKNPETFLLYLNIAKQQAHLCHSSLEAVIYSPAKNFLQSSPAFFHIFPGWYEDNWYEVNLQSENISCTKEEMRKAAEGHLTTEALMWNQNNQKTISGMSSEDFRLVSSVVYPFALSLSGLFYGRNYILSRNFSSFWACFFSKLKIEWSTVFLGMNMNFNGDQVANDWSELFIAQDFLKFVRDSFKIKVERLRNFEKFKNSKFSFLN